MSCRPGDLQDLAYGFLDEEDEDRVRDHVDLCPRCRESLGRLEAEKNVLARASRLAAAPSARWRTAVVPLGFAAALLAGLLWLLAPPSSQPVAVTAGAAPAGQEEKKKGAPKPADEESLEAELKRLNEALAKTSDPQEGGRIKTVIADLNVELNRLREGKSEKPPDKKPVGKGKPDPAKMELEGLYKKLKVEKDPEERMRLEKRIQELGQDMKLADAGAKSAVNPKEVELRLQKNPDDVEALVLRAVAHLDSGKAQPALKDLDRAIELKPDFASAWLKRGLAYAMKGEFERAWKEAKHGEELDLKAGKEIDATFTAIKKLQGASQEKLRRPIGADLEQRVAALNDRLAELRAMAASADLADAERDRARRDAQRVEAEIDRLKADLKNLPPEPVKVDKKK